MKLRLAAVLAVTALAASACSGSDSEEPATVPDDQVIQPADGTPSGFTETDLGAVSIAVPSDWDKQPEAQPAENITSTVWRGQLQDGIATGGVDVRVITNPQQPADKASQALAISAMATLGGRNIEPQEIVWPKASSAYFLEYEAQAPIPTASPSPSASPAVTPELATRTLVLDLADGTQVQVTALSADSEDVPAEVLSTVVVQVEPTQD
ncbi:hypothetical protein [Aeromicrobium sp. 50.2.37]|uniref:hypothetical protein n=1 Tax=Aeromicrobium sp. 50.2.37 TaxID=2969305 RepID=UPI002150596C|nr:hypothetical protein [Aeromicrobium sp. 50.2.37]MCR4513536.1 hypothetical protein [Aeromicrobium sp. 50.2.37]